MKISPKPRKNSLLRSTNVRTLPSVTNSKCVRCPAMLSPLTGCLSRRILTYLIPLRIIKGHLPSEELLQRFPALANIYMPFIHAIRTGDVKAYDKALEQNEQRLLELNLWLTLEKARELSLRGLFRKMCVIPAVWMNGTMLILPQLGCC
jgi:hypothetical protein